MAKKMVRFMFVFALLCCFSNIAMAAEERSWESAKTDPGVFYIPIDDYYDAPWETGWLYGWGIRGVKVKESTPSNGWLDSSSKGGECVVNDYNIITSDTIPPVRTFSIALDSETPLDASFEILIDIGGEYLTLPIINDQGGLSSLAALYNHDEIYFNNFIISVQLDNGTASTELYLSGDPNVAAFSKHTFNFTIAPPDTSGDPNPDDVTSIEITTPPTKTEYVAGQMFSRTGMVVTATLKNENTAEISGYAVAPEILSYGDTEVTISFGDSTAKQAVTVLPSTAIADVSISNGQMWFEWEFNEQWALAKKADKYDAVALYGQTAGKFSFSAGGGAEVFVGEETEPRTVGGDGLYHVELPAGNDENDSKKGATSVITVKAGGQEKSYTFNCFVQAHSGMPSRVAEFLSIGSQYTNIGIMNSSYGINPWSSLRGYGLTATTGGMYAGPTSLGNFGGYIVYEYDEPITDDPNNPYGVDFIVYGNAYDPHQGFAEPGNVLVSEDGAHWYTLAGSAHYEDYAIWDYEITYENKGGKAAWTDSLGRSGGSYKYPNKLYYPLFDWNKEPNLEQEMTLKGVLLDASGTDEYGSASAAFPDFGYADTGKRGESNEAGNPYIGLYYKEYGTGFWRTTNEGFDLKWAVDEYGQPVDLSGAEIRYIKIQTADNVDAGAIGEKSTEINGVRRAAPAESPVALTSAPTYINVDGVPVSPVAYEAVNAEFTGAFTVDVNAPGANVYINGARGASRTFAGMPAHGMLRVIVQEGNKEPLIYYMNLTEDTSKPDTSTRVTFETDGGGAVDAITYTPQTPSDAAVFPIPTRDGYEFKGWFDEYGNRYESYSELADAPANITLTARWDEIEVTEPGGGETEIALESSVEVAETLAAIADLFDEESEIDTSSYAWPITVFDGEEEDGIGSILASSLGIEANVLPEGDVERFEAVVRIVEVEENNQVKHVLEADTEALVKSMDVSVKALIDETKALPLPPQAKEVDAQNENKTTTVLLAWGVTFGSDFDGLTLDGVIFVKFNRETGKTERLPLVANPAELADGKYVWTDVDGNHAPGNTEIEAGDTYKLTLAIKDGGAYDLSDISNFVLDPPEIFPPKSNNNWLGDNSVSGGGGCDSGAFAALALALALMILPVRAALRARGRSAK